MKLLIVDDEKLTRDGLVNSIDWQQLGITVVASADDGLHGLEVAKKFCPDIVLSDVRMPRMTGIRMARELQEHNPDISIIFMSGYSDKEYLKAAIKIKAVSYVEKPIDLEEIKETVLEACQNVRKARKVAGMKALSISKSRSALAERLMMSPRKDMPPIQEGDLEFPFPMDKNTPFFAMLIRCYHNSYEGDLLSEKVAPCVSKALAAFMMQEVHCVRGGNLFVYHIWGTRSYTDKDKNRLGISLEENLSALQLTFHIIFGKNVLGMLEIHNSFNSAVIEMQNSFFDHENTHRIYKHIDKYDTFSDIGKMNLEHQMKEFLLHKDEAKANVMLDKLIESLLKEWNVLPNQVKDLYYKLFTTVRDSYKTLHINASSIIEPDDSIWGAILACESIYELHSLLKERVKLFFELAGQHTDENRTVYLIKQFVAENYQDEALSIKDISSHVHLSFSYICTLFKNETGMTLNQYLTEYRIAKAKMLLEDPRYKIVDISSKVGYSDGNYFGKIFKRMTGMSPSEYKDRTIYGKEKGPVND